MDRRYIEGDIPWSFDHLTLQKNTSELATIARRHNFEPLYEEHANSNNHSKWTNANVFFSNNTINSDLNGIHNTDFRGDHNDTFCYLCSINQHEHERTKPRDESKRRKLIPYQNPKARLSSSSADRIDRNPSPSLDLISYRFIVRTGTKKNSGTRAQVFLYMYGTEKDWTSIPLQGRSKQNSSASIDGFPSGSVRTFCLKGPDIGQLHHLNVNLVGSRSDKEWFLQEIEITNLNSSTTWLCEFNCWLPKTDEEEVKHTKANVRRQTKFSLSIYILQILTGEKAFAGTDANVQIIVRGSKSQTRRLVLTSNRANLFEQNQLDTFAIVGWDLGDLLEISVESDRSQLAADWDIKEMIMWRIIPNDDHEQSQIYFPFNTWLGRKVSTLKSKREIYPSTDHHFKGPICYQVNVKTGKVMNAGTDANVFLIIYGKYGRTVIHQLNNRLKNDFERNSISEFNVRHNCGTDIIMDIDIGTIDRIKIWHDNSGPGSAWFLDSIIIRKKYSTCYTISNIYTQRLEQISQALYRQIREQLKQNRSVQKSSIHRDEHLSVDRQSLKSNDYDDNTSKDRLGNSRSILRSPTMYDKVNLQKKVTWDEHSIGSQDDLFSINSQHTTSMPTIDKQKHQKENLSHPETGHFDHQAYWISTHKYLDHKWHIKSIEEINSFDFDQSTRAFLLSDRIAINNKIQTTVHENEDEIYEFQANRWLAKDKEDGKLEVYLTGKLIHKSSITGDTDMDSKKKPLIPPNMPFDGQQRQKFDDKEKESRELKRSSPHNLGSIERSPKDSTSHDLRVAASRSPATSKTQRHDLHSLPRNIDPSSRSNIPLKKQEESPRINPSIDRFPLPSSSLTQRSKLPHNIHDLTDPISSERELLARITGEPTYHSLSTAPSLISPIPRSKSPRNIHEREPSTKLLSEPPTYPRLTVTPTSPASEHVKSLSGIHGRITPITSERESFTKISDQSPFPLQSSATSLLSSDRNIKPSRSNNDLTTSLPNPRHTIAKISREPPNYSRSAATLISSSSQPSKSQRGSTKDLMNPLTGEQELLARVTGESSYRSPSPTTSLTPLNQRAKSPHNTNNLINSFSSERDTLAKISPEPFHHPRSTATPKSTRLSNESSSSAIRTSMDPPSRPKSSARSNPNFSSQKSIYDQVYSSSYGTAPSDDF